MTSLYDLAHRLISGGPAWIDSDRYHMGGGTPGEGRPPWDQLQLMMRRLPNRGMSLPARNATVADLAALMRRVIVDRSVIDKTGLATKYDFDLEWMPEGAPPAANDADARPDIFTAMRQHGPGLEPAKGQVEILVIDRVERQD